MKKGQTLVARQVQKLPKGGGCNPLNPPPESAYDFWIFYFNLFLLKKNFLINCRKVSFDRLHFFLDNAVGEHLGSVFEVKGTKLHKISDEDDLDDLLNIETSTG